MAKERLSSISGFIFTVFCLQVPGSAGITNQTLLYGCSRYTFYAASQPRSVDFDKSKAACKVLGSDLVSIESNEEWNFLKDTVNKFPRNGTEYYIGLTKDKHERWRWISNNSTVDKSYWAKGQPSDEENLAKCAIMYKDFEQNYGLFNDLACYIKRHGYICERVLKTANCSTVTKTAPSTKGLTKTPVTEKAKATSSHKLFSVEESSTEPVPNTYRKTNTRTTYTNPKTAVPEEGIDESPDITVIILILLAVIILALLIVFFIIFSQRRRRNKAKVSSQSGKQPRDPKHCLHSSTELTVHFSMTRAQEERITIKTVKENNEEYAVVDEDMRKSKCYQRGPSSSDEEGVQSPPNDDHTAADQSALKKNTEMCDKDNDQKEKGHHVYANVLVKESRAVMFCKTTASPDASPDVTFTEECSTVGEDPVEDLNHSILEKRKEINSNEAMSGQDPNRGTECNDHFYAVVDKSKKKQMAPKKPLPYSSGHLMYADMSHLPNNKNGKVHRACASTVYADINHSAKREEKTGWKPKLPKM